MVSHDLLGDATVSKPARERDGYLNIEWTRTTGKGAKKQVKVQNRWVLPSTLHKIGIEVRKEQPIQQGIFGNMPNLAAHERERGREGGAGGRRPAGGRAETLIRSNVTVEIVSNFAGGFSRNAKRNLPLHQSKLSETPTFECVSE